MKYTTKDIIKQAQSIADMENTKIFSHSNMTDLLNQAWKQACQSLINKGCHYFYKTTTLPSGYNLNYNLPSDFYQLANITSNGVQIPRKNGSNNSFYYDIVGDFIEVKGASNNIVLEYYTSPQYLTYKDFDLDWEKPEDLKSIESASGDYILYRTKDDDLAIYNLVKKEVKLISGFAIDDIVSSPGFIYIKAQGSRVLLDWDFNELKVLSDEENIILIDNNMLIYKLEDDKINIYTNNDVLIDTISTTYKPNGTIYSTGNIILGYVDNKLIDLETGEEFSPKLIKIVKDGILLDTKLKTEDGLESTDVLAYDLLSVNEKGFITNNKIIDYTPDTLLDFPNTLFFEYLSSIVAYLMVLKTGGDLSQVQTSLSISEYAFYDSLDNSSSYKVIRNVY